MPPTRGRGLPRGVIALLAIAGALFAAAILRFTIASNDPHERLYAVRAELRALRAAADSCRSAVEDEEVRFRAYDQQLDSLRGRVDRLESLDPRGVPADSYDIYLEAFESYNRGVPGWEAAAESLEAHWRSCRRVVRRHNTVADSARALAEELDVLPEAREPSPSR